MRPGVSVSTADLGEVRFAAMSATQVLSRTQPSCSACSSAETLEDETLNPSTHESYRHPLGVRPAGNGLTSQKNLGDAMGSFGRLPDSLLLQMLEYLAPHDLTYLGSTCRGLFAYCSFDQLWRDAIVNWLPVDFQWRGSWRASVRKLPTPGLPSVDCSFLFSDALHRPFSCSQIDLRPYVEGIPKRNLISRLGDLDAAEFDQKWADQPFILTKPVKKWSLFQNWSQEYLEARYGQVDFRAESVDWPLKTYFRYMESTQDESPLYLFDRSFVEKMDLNHRPGNADYAVPQCFQQDLFSALRDQRPDHRWLIIGPRRSGSTFHKDPNATSAWNAVIRGSKYWIMFPAAVTPPGVFVSNDQSEVTSPLSIAEWLLTFHEEARRTLGCLEGICGEGEVLHVPSGWWHLVVNLETSIAITQNFVPHAHLGSVIGFLRNRKDQVSGFRGDIDSPVTLFLHRLKAVSPGLVEGLEAQATKKRKWHELVGNEDGHSEAENGRFSFGFDDDLDAEED